MDRSAEHAASPIPPTSCAHGRPPKAGAKSPAERAKTYRERLKSDGLKEVKCYLDAEHLAYLRGICDIHGGTIADAVALAVSAVMRGELSAQLPAQPPIGKPLAPPSVILLP